MKRPGFSLVTVSAILALTVGAPSPARAGKACGLQGNWTDSFAHHYIFKTNRIGVYQGTGCKGLIAKLTGRNGAAFSIAVTDQNAGSCGQSFTESLVFSSDCTSASGTYLNADGGGGNVSWARDSD